MQVVMCLSCANGNGFTCWPQRVIRNSARRWDKQGCIFAGGHSGAFDSRGAGAHCVVRDLDTRRYYLFYEAFNDGGKRSIGLATSDDGTVTWQRHADPVLTGSGVDGTWDCDEVGAPCAVSMAAGKWRLYYAGKDAKSSAWQGIGVALSQDQEGALAPPTDFRRRAD
jgi:hypothetical protein